MGTRAASRQEGRGWAKFGGASEPWAVSSAAELVLSPDRRPLSPSRRRVWPPRRAAVPPPSAGDPPAERLSRGGGKPQAGWLARLDGVGAFYWRWYFREDCAIRGSQSVVGLAGPG